MVQYTIRTVTGPQQGAGTSANVFINIFGQNGSTGDRILNTSKFNFGEGKTDTFIFEAEDVGPVEKIKIGHDNAGFFAGNTKISVDHYIMQDGTWSL